MSYIGNVPTTAAFLVDTFSGTGSQTAFTMTIAPANTSSIIVAITGVLQDPSTYSVSGTTLTFSAAPPSGTSNISVRYLGIPASGVTTTAYRTVTNTTATAGQTSFTIPSYTVGYVDVYRNGVYLPSADYTATTGTTVVLTNAATVGDTITTISFYVSSVLNAIPATSASIQQSYLASGVAGTGPAFSVSNAANQTLSNTTWTKVTLSTKDFDTSGYFDYTTNYRFLPLVAGYYQFSTFVPGPSSNTQNLIIGIYKNGLLFRIIGSSQNLNASTVLNNGTGGSILLYLNGSTDYIELWAYQQTGGSAIIGGGGTAAYSTYLTGCLVRSA